MRVGLRYLVVALLAILPLSLSAQSRGFLSREELDSLVNPKKSAKAAGVLDLSPEIIELGEVDDKELVYFAFELKNSSCEAVTITEFRSSCGCVKLHTKPQTIEPNQTLRVNASFNPAGRSTEFRYRVNIYTSLDSDLPTAHVWVEGKVLSSDLWMHLPERAGDLRLSRREVIVTSRGSESIVVANSGDELVQISVKPTVEGLSLRCEPEVLEPRQEGKIFIEYRGVIAADLDTILILEGIEASPTQRMIKVKLKR